MSILPACMSVHLLSAWCLWKPEVVSYPLELESQAAVSVTVFKTEVNQGLETFCSWCIGLVVLLEVLHSEYSGMSHQERDINFYCALPIISGMSYSFSCLAVICEVETLGKCSGDYLFLAFYQEYV